MTKKHNDIIYIFIVIVILSRRRKPKGLINLQSGQRLCCSNTTGFPMSWFNYSRGWERTGEMLRGYLLQLKLPKHFCITVGLEVVGPSKRIWTGMFVQVFFAIGEMYLALVAYLIREWKWINLACAIPCVIYLTYWW